MECEEYNISVMNALRKLSVQLGSSDHSRARLKEVNDARRAAVVQYELERAHGFFRKLRQKDREGEENFDAVNVSVAELEERVAEPCCRPAESGERKAVPREPGEIDGGEPGETQGR